MVINKFKVLSRYKCLFVLSGTFAMYICLGVSLASGADTKADVIDFTVFHKALEKSDDSESVQSGDLIFKQLEEKYRNDAGFGALKSKLTAAEFLGRQMESQLKKATERRMSAITDELFEDGKKSEKEDLPGIAPAKSFYETSVELFSKPVKIEALKDDGKNFFAKYYDLKLRIFTSSIAKAGQALVITEPNFKGTHDYVLVLPLLHASDKKSVNVDVLPGWMRRPEQLEVFSDSCLLHYGFGFQAMMLAKQSAQIQGKAFSELQFYRSAAKKCDKSNLHVAVDCLGRAMEYIPEKEKPDTTIALQFEIVQLWLDSGDHTLAAGEARRISDTFPSHEQAGKALWLYYYALSKSNNTERILSEIDNSLADKRCQGYKAKLMYMKWWALRRKRDQGAKVAALEYEFLKQYGDDPIAAPVLLSRSTDLLAQQNYTDARALLTGLVEKFPKTEAATQAKKMLSKLEKNEGI